MLHINYRRIATQVGDFLKYETSVKEIGRAAGALFRFNREHFPNESITSQRAQLLYDWVLSLARQKMDPEQRASVLVEFCHQITPESMLQGVNEILIRADVPLRTINRERYDLFGSRNYHPEVVKHSRKLFVEGNSFHAVFEAAKVYNQEVRRKAGSDKDGQALMLAVWGCEKGVLKVTPCKTDTDRNVQDGIKFLSAGLMQAIRNPAAHEPALDWPITEEDPLDILSFISFLFRQLDNAVCFPQ